jgi:hypothetical protein
MYSQVLGIQMWPSFGGYYCFYHSLHVLNDLDDLNIDECLNLICFSNVKKMIYMLLLVNF